MKKYIAYILTGAITFGALSPLTYATPLYQSNIEFEQNQDGTGLSQVVVYDSLNNPHVVTLDTAGPIVPQSIAYYKNNKAIVKATESGEAGLWKVVATNSKDADALTGGEFSGDAASQIAEVTLPNGLNPAQDNLYVVDKGGNLSEPISLVEETTPPSATPSYAGGSIALNVTDAVGIAEIEGTPYPTYPTATTYPVTAGATSVHVVDALGNETDIEIDTTVPQVNRVARKGSQVILTVASAGINLLKVSESNDVSAEGLHDFTAAENTGATLILSTSADTLYVYDIAGHAAQVDLTAVGVSDETGPALTGNISYNDGVITINVSDAPAGIASITAGETTTNYANAETPYPQAVSDYIIATGTEQVTLTDSLGNPTTIDIDHAGPSNITAY